MPAASQASDKFFTRLIWIQRIAWWSLLFGVILAFTSILASIHFLQELTPPGWKEKDLQRYLFYLSSTGFYLFMAGFTVFSLSRYTISLRKFGAQTMR